MTMELIGTSTLTTRTNEVKKASLYKYTAINGEEKYMVLHEYMDIDNNIMQSCTNIFEDINAAIRYVNKITEL